MEDRRLLRFFSLSLCIGLVLHSSDTPPPPSRPHFPLRGYGGIWVEKSGKAGVFRQDTDPIRRQQWQRVLCPQVLRRDHFSKVGLLGGPVGADDDREGRPRRDSIVFLRAENGDLCVGIRTAKRGLDGGGGNEVASGWNNSHNSDDDSRGCVLPYGRFCVFLREEDNKMRNGGGGLSPNGNMRGKGRVRPESVVEAATMAAND
ncbi:hypothetical protein ACFX19_016101 [Malus domestica]